MTTVIDPSGSPVAIFNKSGISIVDMPINMGPGEPLVPIPHFSGHTIVRAFVTQAGSPADGGLELPTNAEIGDLVEVDNLNIMANSPPIYAPSGENINFVASIPATTGARLRKITATDWRSR